MAAKNWIRFERWRVDESKRLKNCGEALGTIYDMDKESGTIHVNKDSE